jgi:hypothetical protein
MIIYILVSAVKRSFGQPFFMEVLIMSCWNIWLIRNGKIFKSERASFAKWRGKFIPDIFLLQHRIKVKYRQSLLDWVKALP